LKMHWGGRARLGGVAVADLQAMLHLLCQALRLWWCTAAWHDGGVLLYAVGRVVAACLVHIAGLYILEASAASGDQCSPSQSRWQRWQLHWCPAAVLPWQKSCHAPADAADAQCQHPAQGRASVGQFMTVDGAKMRGQLDLDIHSCIRRTPWPCMLCSDTSLLLTAVAVAYSTRSNSCRGRLAHGIS